MDERVFYQWLLWAWLAMAAGGFALLMWRTAPYGRFTRGGWGPMIPARLSWVLMESPAVVIVTLLFAAGSNRSLTAWAFLAIWNVHYVYRSWIFAARIRPGHPTPLLVMIFGVLFHLINAYLQGRWLFTFAEPQPASWLAGGRFLGGLSLFVAGLGVNIHSDAVLRRLRRPGESHYAIPRGGLFERVSCPNYLGEIVEWIGWAVLTWSAPGLAFAVWTAANLVPRALACHRWYRRTFPDYPPCRKALLPGLL